MTLLTLLNYFFFCKTFSWTKVYKFSALILYHLPVCPLMSPEVYQHTGAYTYTHTQRSNIRQMALGHTLWQLMLLADTVNLCVRVMGVLSFWQSPAQHTFLSNFKSTLHLLWPPSETQWKLLKAINFYSLHTAPSPWASTGLYTHILHTYCTIFVLFTLLPFPLSSTSFQPPHLSSAAPFIILRSPLPMPPNPFPV